MVPMPAFQAPRGTRDLLPEEAAAMDALQAVVQARALRYGYPRIGTPIFEDREVFVKSSGESSDIVGYEMYEVGQRGEGTGLALRPEGTAAVTRALLEHGLHKTPQPIRFFYWEPMFRGQRPQLLRFREFWQWGLECYGAPEAAADVEIIDFTHGLFQEVGLTEYEIQVNTIGDEACQPKVKAALTEYFTKHRDALSEKSQRRLETNVLRVLDSKEPQDRAVIEAAPKIVDVICDEDKKHFAEAQDGLTRLGDPVPRRADPRAGARLLHAHRVRVRSHGPGVHEVGRHRGRRGRSLRPAGQDSWADRRCPGPASPVVWRFSISRSRSRV